MTQGENEGIFHTKNVESGKSTGQLLYQMQAFKKTSDIHPDGRALFWLKGESQKWRYPLCVKTSKLQRFFWCLRIEGQARMTMHATVVSS